MTEGTQVGIVGSGPAAAAVGAAFDDTSVGTQEIDATAVTEVDLAVVVGPCTAPVFGRVHEAVSAPWIAVELGGIGSRPVGDLHAAVSVLDPGGPCYRCLRSRVDSTTEGEPEREARTTRSDARLAGAIAGRTAVSMLAGDADAGSIVEHPHAERRLLPVPGCACGTRGPADGLDRTHEPLALEAVADRMEAAVDGRLGPVREVGEAESFPAPYYLATLADTSGFSDAEAGPQAAGVDADWTPAFVKAIGEALERYAAGVYRVDDLEVGPADDRPDAVPPEDFVLPPAFEDPDPTEPIPWVAGESLHDGRSVALPAEFTVFPPPTHRHTPSITTGLGLGTDGVGALRSGLTEVVERDATMLAWYSSFEPLGVTVEGEGFERLARRARAEDLSVTPLLMTQDVDVPVVAVAVHREAGWPQFAIGSAADLDAAAAARSALAEALQNWMELRGMGPDGATEDASAIGRYATFPPAAKELLDVDATVPAAELGPAEPPTGREELEALLDRLDAVGLEAFAARLTPRDVETLGFEVDRVLVPGAQPLFTGEPFFGERAERVPTELGFEPAPDRPPHPYP